MPIDENLAQLSNTLLYSAMFVYTLALAGYVVSLAAYAGRVGQVVDDRNLATVGAGAASTSTASTSTASTASAGTASASTVAVLDRGSDGDRAGGSSEPGQAASGDRSRRAGSIAVSLTWLALFLHVASVVTRAAAAQRFPWGNMYEFATAGSAVVTAVFLIVLMRRDVRYLGVFVIGPVLLTLGLAITVFYTETAQLVPALRSVWLGIHVSVAFVASALYTLAFSTTVLQLIQERREQARAAGRTPRGAFMDALPTSRELERSSFRLYVAAFPLWGFTLIAGAIWAESAWGRYWNWDPKEVWTFIIWVVYAAHLHARATRGWSGRRAAYIGLVGYACLLANFLLVNFFAVGKHTYAS